MTRIQPLMAPKSLNVWTAHLRRPQRRASHCLPAHQHPEAGRPLRHRLCHLLGLWVRPRAQAVPNPKMFVLPTPGGEGVRQPPSPNPKPVSHPGSRSDDLPPPPCPRHNNVWEGVVTWGVNDMMCQRNSMKKPQALFRKKNSHGYGGVNDSVCLVQGGGVVV